MHTLLPRYSLFHFICALKDASERKSAAVGCAPCLALAPSTIRLPASDRADRIHVQAESFRPLDKAEAAGLPEPTYWSLYFELLFPVHSSDRFVCPLPGSLSPKP
jgi:hypothetical protein